MEPPHRLPLFWQHARDRLELRVNRHPSPVPAALADQLTAGPVPMSADPAHDVLQLERRQRQQAFDMIPLLEDAEKQVAAARNVLRADAVRQGRLDWDTLRSAADAQLSVVNRLEQVCQDSLLLRRWICSLRALRSDDGPLGRARRGWLISAERPDFMTVFHTEEDFLQAEPARSIATPWRGRTIAGRLYGEEWRRLYDEDPRERDVSISGPWTVGYVPTTREVVAWRRCPHLPEELWLIAGNVHPNVENLLLIVQKRMRQPNSVLLLAHAVHRFSTGADSHY